MRDRILVAYASRTGTTAEIAEAVAEELCHYTNGDGESLAIDVRPVSEVSGIRQYNAVILGTAIRGSKILPEALEFLQQNQGELLQRLMVVFAVCLSLREDTEENREKVREWLQPACDIVQPQHIGMFAGALDPQKFSFVMRMMMKTAVSAEGDFRDWEAIRGWAREMAAAV